MRFTSRTFSPTNPFLPSLRPKTTPNPPPKTPTPLLSPPKPRVSFSPPPTIFRQNHVSFSPLFDVSALLQQPSLPDNIIRVQGRVRVHPIEVCSHVAHQPSKRLRNGSHDGHGGKTRRLGNRAVAVVMRVVIPENSCGGGGAGGTGGGRGARRDGISETSFVGGVRARGEKPLGLGGMVFPRRFSGELKSRGDLSRRA